MYAIIETGGKQLKVKEGDVIYVEKLNIESGEKYEFDKIIAVSQGEQFSIGKPYVEKATVKAEVVDNGKGKKVVVYKYKPKKGFNKKKGHRQPYTKLKIESIHV